MLTTLVALLHTLLGILAPASATVTTAEQVLPWAIGGGVVLLLLGALALFLGRRRR